MNNNENTTIDAYGWADQDGNELRLFRRWPDDMSSQIEASFAGKNWDVVRAELSCAGQSHGEITTDEAEAIATSLFTHTEIVPTASAEADELTAIYDYLEVGEAPERTPLPFAISSASNPIRGACQKDRSVPMT